MKVASKWSRVRDALEGEDTVKAKGEVYLPKTPAQESKGSDGRASYDSYRARAEVPDWVAPTHEAMYGLATRKPPEIELPSRLEFLRELATPDGLTLVELHNYVVAELLKTGRMALLSDAPEAGGNPWIAPYVAESLTNWRLMDRTRDTEASMVVLSEIEERPLAGSEFATEYVTCYRVLKIEGGAVVQTLYRARESGLKPGAGSKRSTKAPATAFDQTNIPISVGGGRALTRLPVAVGGVDGLGFDMGPIPLDRMATKTVSYYRISADYRQSLFMTAQPTPFIFGCSEKEIPDEVGVGALWHSTTTDVQAGYIEFSGSGIDAQRLAMRDIAEDAMQIGMTMLTPSRAAESGEALGLRMVSRTASLVNVVISAASIVRRAIQNCGSLLSLSDEELLEVKVTANLDFADSGLPEGSAAVLNLWAKRMLSGATAWRMLQRGDIVPSEQSYEDEQAAVTAEGIPDALANLLRPRAPSGTGGPKE